MKALDMLATLVYGICGGLRCSAELVGYWLAIVVVYYVCTEQLNPKLIICAMLASVALYFLIRIVMEWLE